MSLGLDFIADLQKLRSQLVLASSYANRLVEQYGSEEPELFLIRNTIDALIDKINRMINYYRYEVF